MKQIKYYVHVDKVSSCNNRHLPVSLFVSMITLWINFVTLSPVQSTMTIKL